MDMPKKMEKLKVGLMCVAVLGSLSFAISETGVLAEELVEPTLPLAVEEEEVVENEEADNESGELTILDNFLEVVPPQIGDEVLEGKTSPNSYIFVTIDNRQISSTENPLFADEEGQFQVDLSASPLLYNQTIVIESYRSEVFELDDVDGGVAEQRIMMPAFDDGESQDVLTPDKDGNPRFLIQPILEGSATIKGRTSLEGVVYGFIDGAVATRRGEIKNGQFELVFIEELESRRYQVGDEIVLSFVGKDGSHYQVAQEVGRLKEQAEEEVDFTYPSLQSGLQEIAGTAAAHSQLLLYQKGGENGGFVQEAIADEKGSYRFAPLNLHMGENYYLLVVDPRGHYHHMLKQEIGGETIVYEKKDFATVVEQLGLEDKTALQGDSGLRLFGAVHDEKKHLFGQTSFINQVVVITSSNGYQLFPAIPVDNLGYWGVYFRELDIRLKKGETLTIQVVDLASKQVLASRTEVVRHLNDEDELVDLPFELGEITIDHRYLAGKVAPDVTILVNKKGTEKLLGSARSNAQGQFTISLSEPLLGQDILYLSAFDDQGGQVAWDAVFVGEGTGEILLPPTLSEPSPSMMEESTGEGSETHPSRHEQAEKQASQSSSQDSEDASKSEPTVEKGEESTTPRKKTLYGTVMDKLSTVSQQASANLSFERKRDREDKLPQTGSEAGWLFSSLGVLLLAAVGRLKKVVE